MVLSDIFCKDQRSYRKAVKKKMGDAKLDNLTNAKASIEHKNGDQIVAQTFEVSFTRIRIGFEGGQKLILLFNVERPGWFGVGHSAFPPELVKDRE